MATLTYMPTEHVPVLAPELVALVDPQPGEIVVDCTFGGGGHARLVAERLGPTGTLICDRPRPGGGRALRRARARARLRGPLRARRLRRRARASSPAEGVRPDVVYMDLGISSLQLDTGERGFSYSYDAPLDMRMDTDQALGAPRSSTSGRSERLAADAPRARRGAPRALDRRRDRPPAPARDDLRAGRGDPRRGPARVPLRPRPSGQAHLPGDPDRRQRRARVARPRRCRPPGRCSPTGGRLGAISFHSLEDRRVKRFLAERARGCVCPPELPGLRLRPRARGRAARAGARVKPREAEIERNPRSRSARLRVARKLATQEVPAQRAKTRRR